MSSPAARPTALRARLREHRWSFAVFGALLVLFATWVIGVPRYAAPDEPAHVIKAFGTARGETIGDPIDGASPLVRWFDGPAALASGNPGCYAFSPGIPASCAVATADRTWIQLDTSAATYPPWYYAVVGGAARLTGQDTSVRAQRTASAIASALVVTAALTIAARLGRRRPAALLVALTPMAVFLLPMVNPNAWEISGVLLVWVMLARLHLREDPPDRQALLAVSAVAALAVVVRPVALAWVAVAFAAYALVDRRLWQPDRRATHRTLGIAAIPLAVAVVASSMWSRYAGVGLADDRYAADLGRIELFRAGFGRSAWLFEQAVGVLGWADTWIPNSAAALVIVGLVSAGALVWFAADERVRWILVGLVAVWLLYPAIYVTITGTPEVWQGRYNLPLLGGLAFCLLLAAAAPTGAAPFERLAPLLVVSFVVAESLAFHQMLRRYMVGSGGDILLSDPAWYPSVSAWLLITVNVAAAATLGVLTLRSPEQADR